LLYKEGSFNKRNKISEASSKNFATENLNKVALNSQKTCLYPKETSGQIVKETKALEIAGFYQIVELRLLP
jgi:ABC-type transporter Mla maintaining outer membrane lipid asymmetry ATPase subunit MlaF